MTTIQNSVTKAFLFNPKIIFIFFLLVSSFYSFAGSTVGCTQGSNCPSSVSFVQPCDWEEADAASPGCDANSWVHEDGTSGDNAGGCQFFLDNTTCDLIIWSDPIDLNCAFCANFNFQINPGDEGLAFTMFNVSAMGSTNFPCSTPFDCGGGAASGSTADGGNLGYSPTFSNANLNNGGALTMEYDIQNNSSDGIADLVNGTYCPHVSINEDGCNLFNLQSGCAPAINDGFPHSTNICWDPTCNELTVYVDGVLTTSLNSDIRDYFLTDIVHFAFSSGYSGGDGSVSQVCNFTVSSPSSSCIIPDTQQLPQSANCTPILLPVTLDNFTASVESKRSISLDWITSNEINNDYFMIQRSYDGIVWENIQKVNGNGNVSSVDSYYTHLDKVFKTNQPIIYYQLTQVDYDGKISDLGMRSVNLTDMLDALIIYPNPAHDKLNVVIGDLKDAEIEVINPLGKLIINKFSNRLTFQNDNHLTIDLNQLEKGVYFIRVNDQIERMIIQ